MSRSTTSTPVFESRTPSPNPGTSPPSSTDKAETLHRSREDRLEISSAHIARIHTTEGYRAGISDAKSSAENVQTAFDQGYPIGAALGFRAGFIVCMLEERVKFLARGKRGDERESVEVRYDSDQIEEGDDGMEDRLHRELNEAREELRVEALLREVEHVLDAREGDLRDVSSFEYIDNLPSIKKWNTVIENMGF